MKYALGIFILVLGIFIMTDLAIKTRYKRKKLFKKNKDN